MEIHAEAVGKLGLIVALAADLAPPSIPNSFSFVLAATAFIAVWRFDLSLILVVLAGGLLGLARIYMAA